MEVNCSNCGDKDVGFIREKLERRAMNFFQFSFFSDVRKLKMVIISFVSSIVTFFSKLKNPRNIGITVSFEEYFKLFDTEVMAVTETSFLGTGWSILTTSLEEISWSLLPKPSFVMSNNVGFLCWFVSKLETSFWNILVPFKDMGLLRWCMTWFWIVSSRRNVETAVVSVGTKIFHKMSAYALKLIFRIIWFDDEGQFAYWFAVAAKFWRILLFSRQKNFEIYIGIDKIA